MRLILRRVRQWPFVLEHLAEIAAVDPSATGWATDKMLGLALRRTADTLAKIFAAWDHHGISWAAAKIIPYGFRPTMRIISAIAFSRRT